MILEMTTQNLEWTEHLELAPDRQPRSPQICSLFTQHELDSGVALGSVIDALFVISLDMGMPTHIFDDFMDGLKIEYEKHNGR
jgi:hypothetical protein